MPSIFYDQPSAVTMDNTALKVEIEITVRLSKSADIRVFGNRTSPGRHIVITEFFARLKIKINNDSFIVQIKIQRRIRHSQ